MPADSASTINVVEKDFVPTDGTGLRAGSHSSFSQTPLPDRPMSATVVPSSLRRFNDDEVEVMSSSPPARSPERKLRLLSITGNSQPPRCGRIGRKCSECTGGLERCGENRHPISSSSFCGIACLQLSKSIVEEYFAANDMIASCLQTGHQVSVLSVAHPASGPSATLRIDTPGPGNQHRGSGH